MAIRSQVRILEGLAQRKANKPINEKIDLSKLSDDEAEMFYDEHEGIAKDMTNRILAKYPGLKAIRFTVDMGLTVCKDIEHDYQVMYFNGRSGMVSICVPGGFDMAKEGDIDKFMSVVTKASQDELKSATKSKLPAIQKYMASVGADIDAELVNKVKSKMRVGTLRELTAFIDKKLAPVVYQATGNEVIFEYSKTPSAFMKDLIKALEANGTKFEVYKNELAIRVSKGVEIAVTVARSDRKGEVVVSMYESY